MPAAPVSIKLNSDFIIRLYKCLFCWQYGDTALHTAARYGHAGVTRILISAKSNLNIQNKVAYQITYFYNVRFFFFFSPCQFYICLFSFFFPLLVFFRFAKQSNKIK